MSFDLEGSRSGYADNELALMDSFGALLDDHCPAALTRSQVEDPLASADDLWKRLGAVGWTAALYPEELGGQGLGLAEAAALLVEAGRHLLPGPFFTSAVLVPMALSMAQGVDKPNGMGDVVEGRRVAALALLESVSSFPDVPVRACIRDGKVTGTKKFVLDGARADFFLVLAADEDGRPGLAWVAKTPAVEVLAHPTVDGRRVCTVTLHGAKAAAVFALNAERLREMQLRGAVLTAAYQLGAAEKALWLAADYARTRVQFDRPIGAFQAISHRLVDAYCALGVGRALLQKAARAADDEFFPVAASRAKVWINDAFRSTAKGALQTFGGIGFTFEHDIHLYFRASHSLAAEFGSSADHRCLLRAQVGLAGAAA